MRRSPRRRGSKEPVFWIRGTGSPIVSLGTGSPNGLDSATVQGVDQLANGGITFTGIDEQYTCRGVRLESMPHGFLNAGLSSSHSAVFAQVVVKCSTGLLTSLLGLTLADILSGGAPVSPAAMDVLAIRQYTQQTFPGSEVPTNQGFLNIYPASWPIKVGRRLQSDESIALLSLGAMSFGDALPTGASFGVRFDYIVSALYSRTLRRR